MDATIADIRSNRISAHMLILFVLMLTAPIWFAWLNPPKAQRHPPCGCERDGQVCMCKMK